MESGTRRTHRFKMVFFLYMLLCLLSRAVDSLAGGAGCPKLPGHTPLRPRFMPFSPWTQSSEQQGYHITGIFIGFGVATVSGLSLCFEEISEFVGLAAGGGGALKGTGIHQLEQPSYIEVKMRRERTQTYIFLFYWTLH